MAKPEEIRLNSLRYRGRFVLRETVPPFVEARRSQGVSQQVDLSSPDSKVLGPFTGGFGRNHIPSLLADDPAQYRRFYDSRIETRFDSAYLSILNEDSTHTGLEILRCSAIYKNDLWGLWQDANSENVVSRKYNGSTTTWEGGGTIVAGGGNKVAALDIIAHKTHLIALYAAPTNDIYVERSTDGITWVLPTTPGAGDVGPTYLSNDVTANEDINAGLLAEIGGEVVAIMWEEAVGVITFSSSATIGDTWTDEGSFITSGDGPLGVAVYPGIDDADKLYVLTLEALYEVDTAPSTWTVTKTALRNNPGGDDANVRRLAVHDGLLWIALGTGTGSPAQIVTMDTSGGTRVFNLSMGLNILDGVESTLLGGVHWMEATENFLYISVGGEAASRNSRILCYTGKDDNGKPQWHHMYRHGTANLEIQWIAYSSRDDGTARLHFAVRTAAGTSDAEFLAEPNANPSTAVTIKRQTSGRLDLPEIDGGLPTTPSAWLQVAADVVGLSSTTSGEYIDVSHGLESAVRTTTDLGDLLSGAKILDYALGAGESGVSDALRLVLNRDGGSNTDSPELRSLLMLYQKKPATRKRYIFEVDLQASAVLSDHGTTEKVIANLNAAEVLATKPALKYSKDAVAYVDVKNVREGFNIVGGSGPSLRQRKGTAEVIMEEVV